MDFEREYGWDDEIQKDNEFVIIPEGDYPFMVESFTRERFNGSDKMPACPKAVLKLKITTKDGQSVIIQHSLLLHSRCEWSLSEFFAGIGHKKKGEKLRMNWSIVPGSTGTCKVGKKIYNGNEYNEIKKFYPKDPSYHQQSAQNSGNGYTAGKF